MHPRIKRVAKYSPYKGTVGRTATDKLRRRFDVCEPDTVWSTDVTEFKSEAGKVYLSPIKDFCTGEIISYRRSASPDLDMVMEAIAVHPCASGLMMHSDQGWQYQHSAFVNLLKANGITQSMSRKGNCLDNSKMESFFGTMKNEMYYGHEKEFKTRRQLYDAIDEYIGYYNEKRIQMKLNRLSPLNFRKQAVYNSFKSNNSGSHHFWSGFFNLYFLRSSMKASLFSLAVVVGLPKSALVPMAALASMNVSSVAFLAFSSALSKLS